jgi:3-hydroxyisobutyrate dehydrogenase
MGFPMAGHVLERGGHEVVAYNRSPARADAWRAMFPKGKIAATPAAAAGDADFVFACVGNDDDVRQVTLGADGAFDAMAKGAVFIDNTTTSATLARDLSGEARKRGFEFLDCPVSGGQAGAGNGVLTVMAGGEAAAFAKAEPVIKCFARMVRLIGPAGAGQLTKMVNQIAIAGLVQGLS